MRGFGGYGAGGGADGKPFGGASDAAPGAASARDFEGLVSFFGERGRFGLFVGKVTLSGGEFRLAGLAIEREVVQRLEILNGNDDFGLAVICGDG